MSSGAVAAWGPTVVHVAAQPPVATPTNALSSPSASFGAARQRGGGNAAVGGAVVTRVEGAQLGARADGSDGAAGGGVVTVCAPVGPSLAAPVSRADLALEAASSPNQAGLWNRALATVGVSSSDDASYWTPDPAKGDFSLLEAFLRKRDHNAMTHHNPTTAGGRGGVVPNATPDGLDSFVLVYSRPADELARNFANHRGERVDLRHARFHLSRAALALKQLEEMNDEATLRGRDVKAGLRGNLPKLQTDEYFLVSYRDYGAVAVKEFAHLARRTRLGGSKYVELYFAIRVGQSEGVFIPITAAQFQRGWETLATREISAAGANPDAATMANPEEWAFSRAALSADQFRSLGPLPKDLLVKDIDPAVAAVAAAVAGGAAPFYRPGQPEPNPWDLTPPAVQWRLQRYMERQYTTVGRVAVKGAVVVGAALLVRYAVLRSQGEDPYASPPSRRHGGGGYRRGGRDDRYDDRTAAEALADSVMTLNPFTFVGWASGTSGGSPNYRR